MIRILDRYLLREIALPTVIGLTVLTFILALPPFLLTAEEFISRGVEWTVIARALIALLPQALCLTIPMSVLIGILVGFGRVSGDREFVAMQACGVSMGRLARPVLLLSVLGTAATVYETVVALPDGNQTYREIVYVLLASRVESTVKPRVFFQDFPNKVIYVRELPPEGGWRDVFLADTSNPAQTTVYFAREGRIRLDADRRLVQLELLRGSSHTALTDRPDDYETRAFDSLSLVLDPDTVFRRPPPRGAREMTYAELREEVATASARGDPAYDARFMIQQKASLPLACPILALIGLALGASNRKDGRLASFALGMVVIFLYYVLLWGARAAAMGGRFSPEWAPWTPNILLGAAAVVLLIWRSKFGGARPSWPSWIPFRRRGKGRTALSTAMANARVRPSAPSRVVLVVRVPRLHLPRPRLLDRYVSREYLRVFALGLVSLLGLFYISTFIDLFDKLLRGEATVPLILRYFYYQTPQFVYWVIPMGVLVSTLVTVGVLTKSGEMLVMRACGISLYRASFPLLLFAAAASGLLFVMQERVLATANREADRLNRQIRRWPPAASLLSRRWVVGAGGEMYHYAAYDQRTSRFENLLVYSIDEPSWELRRVLRAADVAPARSADSDPSINTWVARRGWERELALDHRTARATAPGAKVVRYVPFDERTITLEPVSYFRTDEPIAEFMTYAQLRDYVTRLRASGANVVPQMVALQRKVAFPFVTLIMTVLAVPFAVTTGRRGAMYGIGVGIVLAIVYWVMQSVTGALGAGGLLPPFLAAWAPNIFFGAAAAFMALRVRT